MQKLINKCSESTEQNNETIKLLKDVKVDLYKWAYISCSWFARQCKKYSKLHYKYNVIPVKYTIFSKARQVD